MADCLFCRIVRGEVPSRKVYEDERIYAFEDIAPKAPVHVLVIPKRHVATLNDLGAEDSDLLGNIVLTAAGIARDRGIAQAGYRTVFNVNRGGGQVVYHLHLHLLGGRTMEGALG